MTNTVAHQGIKFKQIGIIGLGLIGGSVAKRLHELGIVVKTEGSQVGSDLVLVATPLSTILSVATGIDAPLIIDVGSIKGEIAKGFEEMSGEGREFVATHPMAGSEKSGYENSRSDLFVNAPWIVTPHGKNSGSALAKVEAFITLLGARVLSMDSVTHDRRVAMLSQLPHLLSVMLYQFVQESDPGCLEMAGPGFKSMTRLSQDNPVMRQEMNTANAIAFTKCKEAFYDALCNRCS